MFTINKLADILSVQPQALNGGTLPAAVGDVEVTAICTDTRKLNGGELFLTLKGPRFNGNDYLLEALQKGAVAFIADEPETLKNLQASPDGSASLPNSPVFLVPDALAAYGKLAGAYRRSLPGKVIAVTGSVGKTGTRDMIAAGLRESFQAVQTEANLNNYIGLAQTILGTGRNTEVLVVEAGIDGPGQMEALAQMAAPDIAVITMVGLSHIEHFADRSALIREKAALANGLTERGWLLLNANDEASQEIIGQVDHSRIGLVAKSDDELAAGFPEGHILFRAADINVSRKGTSFSVFAHESAGQAGLHLGRVSLPAIGGHHVLNALFACLCAYLLEEDFAAVAAGLSHFVPTGNRQRLEQVAGITVVNDTYNASEESMHAGFDLAAVLARDGGRFIAVLGSINELGDAAEAVHYRVGKDLFRHRPAAVFLLGDAAEQMAQGFRDMAAEQERSADIPVRVFADREDLIAALQDCIRVGDVVFVKGSHSYHMEAVCEAIADFAADGQRAEAGGKAGGGAGGNVGGGAGGKAGSGAGDNAGAGDTYVADFKDAGEPEKEVNHAEYQ